MSRVTAYLRRRAQRFIRGRTMNPTTVTYRQVTKTAGPTPALNPPRHGDLLVSGAHLAAAMTLNLSSAVLVGRVVAGDRFLIGADWVEASATATAAANAIAVPLTYGLPNPLAGGEAVTPQWAADIDCVASVKPGMQRLVEGKLTQVSDYAITVAAADLGDITPRAEDVVTWKGMKATVLTVEPMLADGDPFAFILQVQRR